MSAVFFGSVTIQAPPNAVVPQVSLSSSPVVGSCDDMVIDPTAWPRPSVVQWLVDQGVEEDELRRVFNIGIGMIAVVPAAAEPAALEVLHSRGVTAWTCGTVRDRRDGEAGDAEAKGGTGGAVTLRGDQPVGRSSSSSS
jgi:hypothetical protein